MDSRPIVYFDGVCGLCNRFVDFLIRHDRARRLRFAPLQGETAARRLGGSGTMGLTTILFEADGRVSERSTAALEALARLRGAVRLLALLRVVPRPVRDAVYDWVARHRYGWFGRRESCRLPAPEEREVFLP